MKKGKKKNLYKYLIEILIITVGVLIAFSLTNWGESIKEGKREKEIIAQIYFELNDNLIDLKNDFEIHKNALKSQLRVQKFIDSNSNNSDSLLMDFYWMTKEEYIFPNTSAFENLKSSGMSIIKNDSLRDLITLVYNNYFPRISKGNNFHPDINKYLTPYFKKNFKVNRDASLKYDLYLADSLKITYPRDFGGGIKQIIGYIPLHIAQLKNDEEFRFLLSEVLWFRIYKINYYQIAILNTEKIKNLIETNYPETIISNKKKA